MRQDTFYYDLTLLQRENIIVKFFQNAVSLLKPFGRVKRSRYLSISLSEWDTELRQWFALRYASMDEEKVWLSSLVNQKEFNQYCCHFILWCRMQITDICVLVLFCFSIILFVFVSW